MILVNPNGEKELSKEEKDKAKKDNEALRDTYFKEFKKACIEENPNSEQDFEQLTWKSKKDNKNSAILTKWSAFIKPKEEMNEEFKFLNKQYVLKQYYYPAF